LLKNNEITDQMKYSAVIFDLFGTLVENLSDQEYRSVLRHMASVLSAPTDKFTQLWFDTGNKRMTGVFPSTVANIEYICRELGVPLEDTKTRLAAQIRFDFTARAMTPQADAIKVLSHLKSEGYKTGLISGCSSEVPGIWRDTPFAPLIDIAVFSCSAGMNKPDPRIYQLATEQLAVEPHKCLYIGDGADHELTGASQFGMNPVLIRASDVYYPHADWTDREQWDGPVISSLKDVLTLVE